MDNAIQVAAERMLNLTVDVDVITAHDKMLMASCDRTSEINFAHSKGIEKGIEKGIKKGVKKEKLLIAKNLISEGSSTEFIQKITGLDLNTIEALRRKL